MHEKIVKNDVDTPGSVRSHFCQVLTILDNAKGADLRLLRRVSSNLRNCELLWRRSFPHVKKQSYLHFGRSTEGGSTRTLLTVPHTATYYYEVHHH